MLLSSGVVKVGASCNHTHFFNHKSVHTVLNFWANKLLRLRLGVCYAIFPNGYPGGLMDKKKRCIELILSRGTTNCVPKLYKRKANSLQKTARVQAPSGHTPHTHKAQLRSTFSLPNHSRSLSLWRTTTAQTPSSL